MKKSHWEYTLTQFPQFKADFSSARPVGVVTRINDFCDYLKFNNKKIISADGQKVLNTVFAAQYFAFAADGAKVYKIAREFGEKLAKVRLNITCNYLPITNKIVCFEFPDNLWFDMDDGKYARCAYVYTTNEILPPDPRTGYERKAYIKMVFPLYTKNGTNDLMMEMHEYGISIHDLNDSLEVVCKIAHEQSTTHHTNTALINFVFNCLVYLNSGDPDLRQYRAPRPPKTAKPKVQRLWARKHEDTSLIDMTLVGYDWKKEVVYGPDQTTVSGHPRWQPYKPDGPGTEWKVKLIFIEPFARKKRMGAVPTAGATI